MSRTSRFILATLTLTSPVAAGEPDLVTDRPDFTESSLVVPRGRFQLEMGFTYAEGKDGVNALNAPELLVRYGLAPRTELRLVPPEYFRARGAGRGSGFGDMAVGLKQQFGPLAGGWESALIVHASLPTGARAFSSRHLDPEAALTWSRDLDSRTGLSGQFAFSWPTEGSARNFTFGPTLSVARSLGGPWGTFVEWAAEFPERGGVVHLAHHGYTYSLTPTSQVDVHFGFGLTAAAPEFFIGAGYARRFR